VIGGIQMVDGNEADDKIIAVLDNDQFWAEAQDIDDIPEALHQRLSHYFATYKMVPGQPSDVHIEKTYGREHALKVVQAALDDYQEVYGE
jgi:inorganic pyrophosphatase